MADAAGAASERAGAAGAPGRTAEIARRVILGVGGIGLLLVVAAVVAAVAAPWVAPYDPVELNPAARLQGPTPEHWLGTDQYGRDTLSRIIYGGRSSLSVAFATTGFALLVGGAL